MAPTSSIMPIKDPVAERRLYISMLALLLIALEFIRRAQMSRTALAAALSAVLLVAAVLSYNRNQVWTDRIALWEDTAAKSPGKARAHFQLGYAYFELGKCDVALPHYRRVQEIQGPAYDLMVDWALAYDCLNRPDDAIAKLRQATALERNAHAYSLIGMVYGKQSRWQEALDALNEAEKINPSYAMTFVYRGGVKLGQGETAQAIEDYRRAIAIDPSNEIARQALAAAEQRLRAL
jgi:tetratricopeptide (TPR) repeat protein